MHETGAALIPLTLVPWVMEETLAISYLAGKSMVMRIYEWDGKSKTNRTGKAAFRGRGCQCSWEAITVCAMHVASALDASMGHRAWAANSAAY